MGEIMKRIILLLLMLLLIGCQNEEPIKVEVPVNEPVETESEVTENEETQPEVVEEVYSHDQWLIDEEIKVIERLDYDNKAVVIADNPDIGYELIILSEHVEGVYIRYDLSYFEVYIDKDQSNHLEIKELENPVVIVHGDGVASSPGRVLMYDLHTLEEIFNDEADDLTWIDINGDGIYEIHTRAMYGGQVTYDIGFSYVYALKDGKYQPDYDLTRQYVYDELKAKELILKENLTLENLNKVLETYAYLGDSAACQRLVESYSEFLSDYPELLDSGSNEFFLYRFGMWGVMSSEYHTRWVRFRYLDNLKQIFVNEDLSWNEYTDFIYADLDKDGIDEALVSFTRDDYTDYGLTFLMDENTYSLLQEQGGYYVDEVMILPFGEDLLIYEQVTNGVYPLGSVVTKYENNELDMLYRRSSATGSGYSYPLDIEGDGIYDGISHAVSDYGVFYHPIEWLTLYKDGKMEDGQINYFLEEMPTESEAFVFHYLDVLWLSQTYGSNEETTNRLAGMDSGEIDKEKLEDFIAVMFNFDNLYEEEIVKIEKLDESEDKVVYSVKTIGETIIEIHVTVKLNELKIIKVETL